MTDMRARYLGRWARTFAMVLSFLVCAVYSVDGCFRAAVGNTLSPAIRAAKLRAQKPPVLGIARQELQ